MQFEESHRIFTFASGWRVIRFDKHPYFIKMSGAGFKAIDFLGVHPREGLLLLEVKYYRKRHRSSRTYPELEEVADILDQKFSDSLQAISIIDRHLQRKPMFRWVQPNLQQRVFKWLFPKWSFWSLVTQTSQDPNRVLRWAFVEYDHLPAEVGQNWRKRIAAILRRQKDGPEENIRILGDIPDTGNQVFSLQKR